MYRRKRGRGRGARKIIVCPDEMRGPYGHMGPATSDPRRPNSTYFCDPNRMSQRLMFAPRLSAIDFAAACRWLSRPSPPPLPARSAVHATKLSSLWEKWSALFLPRLIAFFRCEWHLFAVARADGDQSRTNRESTLFFFSPPHISRALYFIRQSRLARANRRNAPAPSSPPIAVNYRNIPHAQMRVHQRALCNVIALNYLKNFPSVATHDC